jgi:hypothetical protein
LCLFFLDSQKQNPNISWDFHDGVASLLIGVSTEIGGVRCDFELKLLAGSHGK